jgi:uncharacterized protein YbjT (DUF2867 family)
MGASRQADGRSHLVAGATGYVGRRLSRRLLEDGRRVRCLARNPSKAVDLARIGAEVVRADVLDPATLPEALEDVEVAYYLVHSMGRGAGSGDFDDRDRRAARAFGTAAAAAGVDQIVYLGGLGTGSRHLESRDRTAHELAAGGLPLAYLRAAAVIGAGSESFRILFHLVRRLPVMVTPRWVATRTQPIGIADAIAYLEQAPVATRGESAEVQIGAPEVTTYGGLMDLCADALGIRRPARIAVPVLSARLSSLWIGLVTPVDPGVARPLIEGLETETVVTDDRGRAGFDVAPTPLREALRRAVAEARRTGA